MKCDRPLHVVVYTDSAGIGGAEISLRHLVATAVKEIQITVAGVSQTVVETIRADRPSASILLPAQGMRSWFAHRRTFQRLQPDIIHLNLCTPWAGAIGLSAALSIPSARVVRVDQLPLRTTDAVPLWRTRALCLRVDAHVAVGQASAQRMEDFYALGRNSVISIPNGVPDLTEPPQPPLDRPDGQLVVGSIGRLDAMKAHEILVKAMARVAGVQVVILGEGDQRSALEQLAADLGVADRLTLKGWVDDPRSYLSQFDVIALPSRSEGFPLAMVEAMLAARPVIATRVGSIPEAILDRQTGLLIEKNDVDGLAQALQTLRDDPIQRLHLGKQAREMAVAHFTVEAMTRQYEHLWQQIVTRPQTPRLQVARPKD